MKKAALAILIIFALFCDLQAKTYVWTDEKGITRISDRAPNENKVKPAQPDVDNEKESDEIKITNAAIYYSKAMELLKYPVDEKLKQKIENVVKNGWDQKDEALKDVIEDNKLCLETIEKAKELTDCDFAYKKPYKYLLEKELPPLELWDLHQLLLVNVRYYEYQENWDQATISIFTALTLAYHMSQDNSGVGKVMALAFERDTYPVIKDCLQTTSSEMESTKIFKFLNTHKKRHFPANAPVYDLKKSFLSDMQMFADGVVENGEKMGLEGLKKKIDDFAKEFMNQANQLANEYYGYVATAVESNKDGDWQKASNAWESLKNSKTQISFKDLADLSSAILNSLIGNTEEYDKLYSRTILITLMAAGPIDSGFKVYAGKYYEVMDELNELLVMAGKKMR